MNLKLLAGLLPLLLLSVSIGLSTKPEPLPPAADAFANPSPGQAPTAPSPAPATLDPAVAAEYAAFDFSQIFVLPAGPKGLEYTPEARRLDGQKVRLSGSMVRHHHDDPALFLFADQPMVLNVAEYGLADSLPPNAVHVFLPVLPGMAPDWVRQPLTLFGRLELGTRVEKDGRTSQVRLHADHITAADGRTVIEPRRSVLLQPARLRSGQLGTPTLSALKPE